MNKKQDTIDRILDIVVECCSIDVNGAQTITRDDVLGSSHSDAHHMTRCMYATQLKYMGLSTYTIAKVLGRSERAVTNMLNMTKDLRDQSYMFRIAEAECNIRVKQSITGSESE